eukprot:3074549-Amphidinium_carterae.1
MAVGRTVFKIGSVLCVACGNNVVSSGNIWYGAYVLFWLRMVAIINTYQHSQHQRAVTKKRAINNTTSARVES